jgi:hypothetical protein
MLSLCSVLGDAELDVLLEVVKDILERDTVFAFLSIIQLEGNIPVPSETSHLLEML